MVNVKDAIDQIESDKEIDIYAARDFGSRITGTDGPDSDRDVLFLFDKPAIEHKRLNSGADTFQFEQDGIDFQGWSTRTFAGHFVNSNPMAVKFLRSNANYYEEDSVEDIMERAKLILERRFSAIALYNHYYSKANSNFRKYIISTGTIDRTIKRYFNVLDSIVRAEMIREDPSMLPPMNAFDLAEQYDGPLASYYITIAHRKITDSSLEVNDINLITEIGKQLDGSREDVDDSRLTNTRVSSSDGDWFINSIEKEL